MGLRLVVVREPALQGGHRAWVLPLGGVALPLGLRPPALPWGWDHYAEGQVCKQVPAGAVWPAGSCLHAMP